ncbi:LuxR C-terminal-related transcriptional regulator [Cohnella lupini]|uniref:LuxR family maltose regulon positive regulatory protein n=1 Tax=Cohnella lupini TaxID=1294267 RepID=A0A3D9I058_9BACL|nr:LuxR C-terminal-related transcriptional regulator [Cohnella lupini]RED55137.1 LuxR family maltose regulon positive regulatory protein [Cohnella lupini]
MDNQTDKDMLHISRNRVLSSKIALPRPRDGEVVRTRLLTRLDEGGRLKLTVITAPAGFGKTTLVGSWLRSSCSDKAAWVSLEKGDGDFVRFWSCVVAAIVQCFPDFALRSESILMSLRGSSEESAISFLIHEISELPEACVLVLDDFHTIADARILESIVFFIHHIPNRLQLPIISRTLPPLPLSRFKLQGQLAHIDADELRFKSDEIDALQNRVSTMTLTSEEIALLERKTEGWAAGLILALLSLEGRSDIASYLESFSGSNRYIIDYLVDEVLNRQTEDIQSFMLQTSILNHICSPLAQAVTEREDTGRMLDLLDRSHLFFIPLDDTRTWYRYHHLFGDMLRARLQIKMNRAEIEALHWRAYQWYEHNGSIREAIDHALEAREYEGAAECIERHFSAIIKSGEEAALLRWLAALPLESIILRPDLFYFQAGKMAASGQIHEAKSLLERTLRLLATSEGLLPPEARRDMELRMGLYRASVAFYQGDIDTFVQLLDENLEGLEKFSSIVKVVNLGEALLYRGPIGFGGRLSKMEELSAKVASSERRQRALHYTLEGYGYVFLADLYYERNKLDEAQAILRQALTMPPTQHNLGVITPGIILLSKIFRAKNDVAGAETLIRQAIQDIQPFHSPHWQLLLEACLVRLRLVQGDRAAGERWVLRRHILASDKTSVSREYVNLTLARLLIEQEQTDDAVHLLLHLEKEAKLADRLGSRIEIHLLLATAYEIQGNPAKVAESLKEAHELAEPEGYVRIFQDEGKPRAELLTHSLPISLTNREETVLRLIAEGRSNEEIARGLYLSEGTVKRYIHHLYQKLEAKNRIQAVSRAKQLQLL